MKDKKESKEKISLSDKIALVSLFLAACDFIFSWIRPLFRLPRLAFVLVFLALLCSWAISLYDGLKEIRNTRETLDRELHKLREESRKDKRLLIRYGPDADRLREEYDKKIRKRIKAGMQKLAVITGIIIVFSLGNYNQLVACGQDILKVFGIGQESSGELQTDDKNQEGSQETEAGTAEAEPESVKEEPSGGTEMPEQMFIQAPKPPQYRFVLEDPYCNLSLEDKIEKQVFFIDHGEKTLDEYVPACMEAIMQYGRQGVDLENVRDEQGNGYRTYTAQEDIFKDKVEKFLEEPYYADWLTKAPKSSEMERYMEGRVQLNMVHMDGSQGCYELWWARANDHQYYAQEYEAQTSNKNAILYHYGMSIYCCMEALTYEMPKEKREMIYHYMVTRYHDMCRDEAMIPPIYKERAESVHAILERDDLLKDTE